LRGAAALAPGQVGEAFSFDGVASYLEVLSSQPLDMGADDFTIEFWTKLRSLDSGSSVEHPDAIFVGKDEGPNLVNKWFFSWGGGRLSFVVAGPQVGSYFLVQAPFGALANKWYHLAVTRSGNVFSIYRDGQSIGSETNSIVIPNPNAPLTI